VSNLSGGITQLQSLWPYYYLPERESLMSTPGVASAAGICERELATDVSTPECRDHTAAEPRALLPRAELLM
jgi:hypothetical protein